MVSVSKKATSHEFEYFDVCPHAHIIPWTFARKLDFRTDVKLFLIDVAYAISNPLSYKEKRLLALIALCTQFVNLPKEDKGGYSK